MKGKIGSREFFVYNDSNIEMFLFEGNDLWGGEGLEDVEERGEIVWVGNKGWNLVYK